MLSRQEYLENSRRINAILTISNLRWKRFYLRLIQETIKSIPEKLQNTLQGLNSSQFHCEILNNKTSATEIRNIRTILSNIHEFRDYELINITKISKNKTTALDISLFPMIQAKNLKEFHQFLSILQ